MLIELLVTISVIVGLTSLLVTYNRTGQRIQRLPRAAEKLVFDIRKVQNYALAVREFAPGVIPCSYGVQFDTSSAGNYRYIIFADLPAGPTCASANGLRSPGGSEDVEVIRMEEGVIVRSANIQTVRFAPPSATTMFIPSSQTTGAVTLSLQGNSSFTRTVTINLRGGVQL